MITLQPYQEIWPSLFQKEKERLEAAFLGLALQFHHIGSTAIVGCAAKPVIDILGVTPDVTEIDSYSTKLEALGYTFLEEYGMRQRRYFRKEGAIHLHIFEDSDPEVCRHLRFVAYLNSHPKEKKTYSSLKKNLAISHPNDLVSYILGKEKWIKQIDSLAIKENTLPLFYPPLGPRKEKWTKEQIVNAMHVNRHLYLSYFVKFHPLMHFVFQPDIVVVQGELKNALLNFILSARFTEQNVVERVRHILHLYDKKGLPFSWWVSEKEDRPKTLSQILLSEGLFQCDVEEGMYRELLDYQPPNEERCIQRVESREHVQAFVEVITSIWGCHSFYEAIYDNIPLPLIQEGASLELYLLFWEGKPVTSGMILFHANVAGIYYVGTHPEYRRRGLGREMTDHLLSRAQAKGYKIVTLQASKEGKSLYERLGFISTCRFIEYSNVAE